MTRPIKFKFYDKEEKRLVAIADVFDTALYPYLSRQSLTPCQFTGLLDKNGKEIYEGDIIKHSFSPGREEIIVVNLIGTLIDLLLSLRNWSGRLRDLNDKVEVIGNIYENPELINNKN